jgi:hypothetical protein
MKIPMVCHQIDEKHLIPFPFALDFPHVVCHLRTRPASWAGWVEHWQPVCAFGLCKPDDKRSRKWTCYKLCRFFHREKKNGAIITLFDFSVLVSVSSEGI